MVEYENGICRVIGSINGETAPQLEAELREIPFGESITLDFADVDYISSIGLRILLRLARTGVSVSVINAGSTVYEVFEMTGFTEICKVSRALREISVEGCEELGRGNTGTVYRIGEDQVVKLYRPGIPLSVVQDEHDRARNAFVLGIPTAIPFELVRCGESFGAVYETMNAVNLGKALQLYPERYDELLDKYVELLRQFNSAEDKDGRFRNIKDVLREHNARLKGLVAEDIIETSYEIIDAMPDGSTLVHGDLHTGNIMLQGDELMVIDMADMTVGPKSYDFMCLYRNTFQIFQRAESVKIGEMATSMTKELAERVWNDLLKRYTGLTDEAAIRQKEGSLALAAAGTGIAMAGILPQAALQKVVPQIEAMARQRVQPNREAILKIVASL